ncbi:hypothetical protein PGTUg99_028371 [Puccinia graminis f. sp. tritici]|uniref:Uncharacterized protein n=1 Tax=Puccinia graminis f. sp. tritici TaxID=56615 RepID=A0A5B0RHJ0_PUCGR|nr:hypothetical protein PGTUg99_028371 [Puccinia graminis f. sp. tritici]
MAQWRGRCCLWASVVDSAIGWGTPNLAVYRLLRVRTGSNGIPEFTNVPKAVKTQKKSKPTRSSS